MSFIKPTLNLLVKMVRVCRSPIRTLHHLWLINGFSTVVNHVVLGSAFFESGLVFFEMCTMVSDKLSMSMKDTAIPKLHSLWSNNRNDKHECSNNTDQDPLYLHRQKG